MATSGSFYTDFGSGNKYRISCNWRRESVDIANNKSTVVVDVYLQSLASGYNIVSSATKYGTLTIDGTAYSFSFGCALSPNETKGIFSKKVDIYHNSDGSRSFGVSASATIDITFSSGKVGTISAGGTAVLDNIPRTSSFSLTTNRATLGSTTVTVNISRASTSFTHNVFVGYGNTYTQVGSNVSTSCSWVPDISLASQTPNDTVGYGSVVVDTYSGGNYIGSTSQSISYVVPDHIKPSFSAITASIVEAGAPASMGYVQHKSKCHLSIAGGTGSYGSTITKHVIEYPGGIWYAQNVTTGTCNVAGTFTYTAYIVDSRGRSSDKKTVSVTVQPYEPPKITDFATDRVKSTGAYSDDGTYALVWGKYQYYSLNGKNGISSKLEYKRFDQSTWTSAGTLASNATVIIGNGGISTAYAYDIRLTVSDSFSSVSKIATIKPAFVTLDFLAGGKGVAIGKECTTEGFNMAMPSTFEDMVKQPKGSYVHEAHMSDRSGNYIKIANISVNGKWTLGCIGFTIMQRGSWKPSNLYIYFSGEEEPTNLTIGSFIVEGPLDAWVSGSSGSWSLWVRAIGNWDVVMVTDCFTSPYFNERITISWVSENGTSVPSPYYQATPTIPGRNWDNQTVITKKDGVTEVGGNLDFHATSGGTEDFNARIAVGTDGHSYITTNWNPNTNNALDLGRVDLRWRQVHTVGGVTTSSDRTAKENIAYVGENGITYEDMYKFIQNDLGLATYNYIDDPKKETKVNFIAQDILVNEDGSDNIIGQLIVKPIPVPTPAEIKEAKKNLVNDQEYQYPTLAFDTTTYTSIIAGALKQAIDKIEELTNEVNELKTKLKAGDDDDICNSEGDGKNI